MAEITIPEAAVVSQEGAQIGDENVGGAREPENFTREEEVAAQVSPERSPENATVVAHETVVHLDEVITDPSSPEAVQVPDAGRSSLSLPIHQLAGDRPEDVFKRDASKADKPKG